MSKFNEWVNKKERGINSEIFQNYFSFQRAGDMLINIIDKYKNNDIVNIIKSGLSDLKSETENMSEEQKEIVKPSEIINVVKKILEFKKQNQQGHGLKILTPNQVVSRLPITLAQSKAGNNSQKRKNEIRQILYSLYRSKKITKQLYKSLVDII